MLCDRIPRSCATELMAAKVKALQQWCKQQCDGYRDVNVTNMTSSWKSGLAFCAIIHRYYPDLIDYDSLSKENVFENNKLAFSAAESLGIAALLDAEDMVSMAVPDKLSIITYVSQYYNYFSKCKPASVLGSHVAVKRPANVANIGASQDVMKRPALTQNAKCNSQPVQSNGAPNFGSLNDRCVVCSEKVYLMERHLENGRLYHRQCIRDQQKAESFSYRNSVYDQRQPVSFEQNDEDSDVFVTTTTTQTGPQNGSRESPSKTCSSVPAHHGDASEVSILIASASEKDSPRRDRTMRLSDESKLAENADVFERNSLNHEGDWKARNVYVSLQQPSVQAPRTTSLSEEVKVDCGQSNDGSSEVNVPGVESIKHDILNSLSVAIRAHSRTDDSEIEDSSALDPASISTVPTSGSAITKCATIMTTTTVKEDLGIEKSSMFITNDQAPMPKSPRSSQSSAASMIVANSAPVVPFSTKQSACANSPSSERCEEIASPVVSSRVETPTVSLSVLSPLAMSDVNVFESQNELNPIVNRIGYETVFNDSEPTAPVGEMDELVSPKPWFASKVDDYEPNSYNQSSSTPVLSAVCTKAPETHPCDVLTLQSGQSSTTPAQPACVLESGKQSTVVSPLSAAYGITSVSKQGDTELGTSINGPGSTRNSTPVVLPVPSFDNKAIRSAPSLPLSRPSLLGTPVKTESIPVPTEGKRPASFPMEEKRPAPVPMEGKRPAPVLIEGKRPAQFPIEGKRPAQVPIEGKRPAPQIMASSAVVSSNDKSLNVSGENASVNTVQRKATANGVKNTEVSSQPMPSTEPMVSCHLPAETPSLPFSDSVPSAVLSSSSNASKSLSSGSSSLLVSEPTPSNKPVPVARRLVTQPEMQTAKDDPHLGVDRVVTPFDSPSEGHVEAKCAPKSKPVAKPRRMNQQTADTHALLNEVSSSCTTTSGAFSCLNTSTLAHSTSGVRSGGQISSQKSQVDKPLPLRPSPPKPPAPAVGQTLEKEAPPARPPLPVIAMKSEPGCLGTRGSGLDSSSTVESAAVIGQESTAKRQTASHKTDVEAENSSKNNNMVNENKQVAPPMLPLRAKKSPKTPPLPRPLPKTTEQIPVVQTDSQKTDFEAENCSKNNNVVNEKKQVAPPLLPLRAKKSSNTPPLPRTLPNTSEKTENVRLKLAPDVTFTFEKDAFRSQAMRPVPLRPAPPPPVHSAIIRRQIKAEEIINADYITERLRQLDAQLKRVEKKGRVLEERIRGQCDEMMDDEDAKLMTSWFKAVKEKNEFVREESILIYMLKQKELEDQHSQVEFELRKLLAKPDNLKTANDKLQEAALLEQLVKTVTERNEIIDSMEQDRIRYLEEDHKISQMMVTKGLDVEGGKKK